MGGGDTLRIVGVNKLDFHHWCSLKSFIIVINQVIMIS